MPRKSGGIAIALQNGFHAVDTATGELIFIADPEPDKPDNRVNDGSCDRMGRFWAGTQHVTIREPHGSLYRLDPDHSVRKMFEGITVTNMVRFSPDDRTLYYADTYSDRMYAFDYSLADGAIANRRVFVDTEAIPAIPTDRRSTPTAACGTRNMAARAWCATRRRAGSTAPSRFR